MKVLILITVLINGILSLEAQEKKSPKAGCEPGVAINSAYSKAAAFDSIMTTYTSGMLPGVSMAVYTTSEGWWAGARGFASLEKKTPMLNCHLQYLQSVSKSFIAVVILQLKEQGKIVLDDPLNKYLPLRYARYLKDAEKITVRMLLNHTSGIPEYNHNPDFISRVVLHPLDDFSSEECLKAIEKTPLQFVPGSKYSYANTNYLILALIGDAITGDHAAYINRNIFKPLGLNNSYYGNGHQYLKDLNLPESYWDIFNANIPVNITPFQKMTVACSKGDDGIVCTTIDAVKFLKGLMEGKLLNAESMKEMMNFVVDEKGNKRYGMGMIYFDLGGQPAYGHGGGGIGAGCVLAYIPSKNAYVFLSTNFNCFVDSNLSAKVGEMRDAILGVLLQ